MNYAKLYQELTDSVMQHIELQQMGKASSTYNYQLQQRKAMVAERKSKQTMFVAFLMCGAMLMMVVILALWFIQNKLHHQKEISAKQIIIDNMLCIGIPSKHISVLLNTSPQNVFGHKKRIVQRLSGSETPSAHDEKQIFYKLRGEMAN